MEPNFCQCGKQIERRSVFCRSCARRKSWVDGRVSGRIRKLRLYMRGYIWLWMPSNKKYKREHIEIAERVLGRKLKKAEVVHHINGDKTDNRNCNLLICSQQYHIQLHHRMSHLYMQEHFSK